MNKLFLICALTIFCSALAHAADREMINGVLIYKKPPNAYELAKSLFPPKTRSIIVNDKRVAVTPEKKVDSVGFMVKFYYDSVSITEESKPYLDSLGEMLNFKQLKGKPLLIEGHADATGDAYYNLQLSEARAKAIKDYLVSVHRIDESRLYTEGYGENKLLDPRHPGADINRRAEFRPK